jgi:hypothetical protein
MLHPGGMPAGIGRVPTNGFSGQAAIPSGSNFNVVSGPVVSLVPSLNHRLMAGIPSGMAEYNGACQPGLCSKNFALAENRANNFQTILHDDIGSPLKASTVLAWHGGVVFNRAVETIRFMIDDF